MTTNIYVIYDERYNTDREKAIALEVCEILEEAQESLEMFPGGVIVKETFEDDVHTGSEIMSNE